MLAPNAAPSRVAGNRASKRPRLDLPTLQSAVQHYYFQGLAPTTHKLTNLATGGISRFAEIPPAPLTHLRGHTDDVRQLSSEGGPSPPVHKGVPLSGVQSACFSWPSPGIHAGADSETAASPNGDKERQSQGPTAQCKTPGHRGHYG